MLFMTFYRIFAGELVPKDDLTLPNSPDITLSAPFYQSMWFILVLTFGFMVVLIVGLACVIHKMGRKNSENSTHMDSLKIPNRASPSRGMMGMYEMGSYSSDDASLQEFNVSDYVELKKRAF